MNKKIINGKNGLCLLVVFFALLAFQSAMADIKYCDVSRTLNGADTYTVEIVASGNECTIDLSYKDPAGAAKKYNWYALISPNYDSEKNTKVIIKDGSDPNNSNVTVHVIDSQGGSGNMFQYFQIYFDDNYDGWSFLTHIKIDESMTGLNSMFASSTLNNTGLQHIAGWNVKNVQNFSGMFANTSISDLSALKDWNVSSGTNFTYMFENCYSLKDITAIKGWKVSSTAWFNGMFSCASIVKADFSSWTINPNLDYSFNFLLEVENAAVKLNAYYSIDQNNTMGADSLYVFGKHSINELKTGSSDYNSVLKFEPYSVAVYFHGGDGSEAVDIITSGEYTGDASTYYGIICAHDAFYDDEPVCKAKDISSGNVKYSDYNKTVTMTFTLPADSDPITSVTATDKNGKKKTLTANADGTYSLTTDTSYRVDVQIGGAPVSAGSGIIAEQPPLPEDEIGTYSFDEEGNKFYIQFHTYDICMNYMGNPDACANTSMNLYNDQRLLNGEYAQ